MAIERLVGALGDFDVKGVKPNIPVPTSLLQSAEFKAGEVRTGLAQSVISRWRRESERCE